MRPETENEREARLLAEREFDKAKEAYRAAIAAYQKAGRIYDRSRAHAVYCYSVLADCSESCAGGEAKGAKETRDDG